MDKCKICSSKNNLETHHIKDQQYANKNNMIDNHHKNIKHNLVTLCKICHTKVTNKELIVNGWIETNKGKVLDWKKSNKKEVKKKFNEDQINIINNIKINNPNIIQT